MGIGGSSAKTDRGNQLAATQGQWNIFNYGLPQGQAGQATGQADLSAAKGTLQAPENYFRSLLTAGRTETAATSAPAVNTALAQSDAARRTEATMGTGRGGGTAAANREASTTTGAGIDQIINQNMVGGRAAGASGLQQIAGEKASIGGVELSNALSLLGLGKGAIDSILSNATQSKQNDPNVGNAIGQAAATLFMSSLGIGL